MKPYYKQYGGPGFDLVERTERSIERYGMLSKGDSVVVAVSGGPDSVCLLDVLARLGERWDLSLAIAHVDHGLSEESKDVAARVSSRGAQEGYEVHLARAPDLAGSNLQARAREFRYEFFEIVAERESAARIATAHTLDDRAETVLARLIHGAGTQVLSGLPPIEGRRVRPLLDSRRAETRVYCVERGLDFFDDPSNEDLRFERPAVRSKLIAAIEQHWGEGAVRAIARSAERLREDAGALAQIAEQLYSDSITDTGEGLVFPLSLMLEMPRALRRRLLEQAVGRVRDRSGGVDAAVDALDARDNQVPDGVRFAVASGIEIAIEGGKVVVSKLGGNGPTDDEDEA